MNLLIDIDHQKKGKPKIKRVYFQVYIKSRNIEKRKSK